MPTRLSAQSTNAIAARRRPAPSAAHRRADRSPRSSSAPIGTSPVAWISRALPAPGRDDRRPVEIAGGDLVLAARRELHDADRRVDVEDGRRRRRGADDDPAADQAQADAVVDAQVGLAIDVDQRAVGEDQLGAAVGGQQAIAVVEQVRRVRGVDAAGPRDLDATLGVREGHRRRRGRGGVLGRRDRRVPQRERHQGRESQPRRHVTSLRSAGHPAGIADPAYSGWLTEYSSRCCPRTRRHTGALGNPEYSPKVDRQALRFHTHCWGGCPQPRISMDLYIVLGVRRSASAEDIRRAYRRLARRYHPDINPGDGEAAARFRDILSAYETLVDPERRRRYDHGEPPPAAPRSPASPASTSPRVSTPSARRPSVISSAAPCSRRARPGGRSAAPISTSP